MRLDAFDFDLPEELIAVRPARPRSSARLLVAEAGAIADRRASDLPSVLRPGDRLVLNDTKVIPARLTGTRRRGEAEARMDVTLLEPRGDGRWSALVRPLRKLSEGEIIVFPGGLSATFAGREGDAAILSFRAEEDFDTALERAGRMPLPPYIEGRRAADDADRTDYQTVWAREAGAVAAPTASLHFDEPLLAALRARGVGFTHVTLHVGAGTFLPVKAEDTDDHVMHAERGRIAPRAAAEIAATRAEGGRVIPVGTTAMRLLETAARETGMVQPWEGATDIFITPGFRFRASDALMTNFHLPRSTLMMLVGAFMGMDRIRGIYAYAIAERYRFFSYGDASLLVP
ncbi:S-adenosylmethionine:tRNA ribosyltransferase-isomerase [Hasllibacter halocynthiae]|uniref:S-adenosylmethionine:tRNA ribosyltransferase-isomerase n=1 Tax=Hasllibacter halocynthiae TaxID=595589 RepID=A0A2T0X808_9RHOB|nr:tRNA preQ1(34) S-adenosylmethionine ribosyltransferase-isomerase QueA [Hasllibacter halocynthiae]PRY95004.1 S-adenosylmethionine:tRNA ribosyltransferase-isomerase [Hasllibacter halocynthiae]